MIAFGSFEFVAAVCAGPVAGEAVLEGDETMVAAVSWTLRPLYELRYLGHSTSLRYAKELLHTFRDSLQWSWVTKRCVRSRGPEE